MIVAAFKFKVNPKFQEEFNKLYQHATTYVSQIDGYEGHEVFNGQNEYNMLVVYFRDKESFESWDKHPEHKKYKERGKKTFF
ncbi:antibiotic biosynthesis monooxygenase [Flavobacterium oreochromis]|uniref:antibiotic biosynthesis monooxygenase family protein n=1 Tax=Flavobacterium oreochromis TaxID=2906078 RepID=UPI001CE5C24E|nr:antibiotic biosynthesis monooxygenase family protein [Flavobacterium oreochromis]QYS86212.1 antibiotic biosynthesis monooxygenase [Flavobacterium oreochromis]